MKTVSKISGTFLTYKVLWFAAKRQMDVAAEKSNDDKYYYLAAVVLMFFSLEAYLNHIGQLLWPETWEVDERQIKGGVLGKLNFLGELFRIEYEKGERPYQTIKKLKDIRDSLAHGRTKKYINVEVKHEEDELPPFIYSEVEKEITKDLAERGFEDIKRVINELHSVVKTAFPGLSLEENPFSLIFDRQSS